MLTPGESPERTRRGGSQRRRGLARGSRGYAALIVLLLVAVTLPGTGRSEEVHALRTELADAKAALQAAAAMSGDLAPAVGMGTAGGHGGLAAAQRSTLGPNRTAMAVRQQVRVAERRVREVEARLDRALTQATEASVAEGLLEQVRSLVRPTRDADTAGRLERPVRGVITSGFGPRRLPSWGDDHMHDGIDIFAPSGTPVRAAAGGEVRFAGGRPESGLTVVVDHGPDERGRRLETVYSHLSEIEVQAGRRVSTGDALGAVGSTGTHSTGPHLHFEVRIEGQAVDPRAYF